MEPARGLDRLTKKQRVDISKLGSEWAVLDSAERLISKLASEERQKLPPGVERSPEIVKLEKEQWDLFKQKREIIAEFVELEQDHVFKRRKPRRNANPFALARDVAIRQSRHLSDKQICERLDIFLLPREAVPMGIRTGISTISELSARREHDRLRNQINRERGSVPPAPRGEGFRDIALVYMRNVAPHLSPSTVRQRTSHLHAHLLPRFGDSSLLAIDSLALQCFATELLGKLTRKTIVNVLGTLLAVLAYAKQCGVCVPDVSIASIKIGGDREPAEPKYFKQSDAQRIIQGAHEPYRTIFALAWVTGLRAGELLGLRVADLDFDRKIIQPRKQADDRTRESRRLKTPKSRDTLPMTDETIVMLKGYLKTYWKENPEGLLFSNRRGRPCKRVYVVRFGLWPVLRRLGLPTRGFGLHAFRHGLGTALADSRVSPKLVQSILRHADIKTTFRYYVHADADAQREALVRVQSLQISGGNRLLSLSVVGAVGIEPTTFGLKGRCSTTELRP